MGLLSAIFILAFFILFHELGHFIAARLCGVKVEVFSIGFGKKLLSFYFRGTQYAISAIPLGGYVSLKGQEEAYTTPTLQTSHYESDSYLAKSSLKRVFILFAGSGFNFFLGFLLYLYICLYGFEAIPPIVGKVVDSMPAQTAGILANDKVLAVNNKPVYTWEDVANAVRDSQNTITMRIQRANEIIELTLTPKLIQTHNIFNERIQHNAIGIQSLNTTQKVQYFGFDAFQKALEKTYQALKFIMQSIQKLISGVIETKHISSIVGITHTMSSVAQTDWIALCSLSALISINLGVFNLLPILPLDGGHILFTLYESLTHKKPNGQILYFLMFAGWILLIGLVCLGIYNDINRIIAL